MNTLAKALPNEFETDELSLEWALAAGGWESSGPACWRMATERGDSLLVEVAHRDNWRHFQLSGGATPPSTNSRVLQDNYKLFGPAKLIARPGDCPICRLDVPDDLTGSMGESFAFCGDLAALDARAAWVRAVTVIATGSVPQETSKPASEAAIADELKQAGWSVSVDDGQAIIHLQIPGVYRELMLEHDQRSGATLAANLIELTDLEDECLRAIFLLAHEANARLPLVRMAIAETSKCIMLRAEVSFGGALVSGSLLVRALRVFEATVGRTAREFEALRDVELARLVISAAAVRNSIGLD